MAVHDRNMPTVRLWFTIFQPTTAISFFQYLWEHGVEYNVIMHGAKVLSLTMYMFNIRFVDSLNFIPMRLANFLKTFGIEELAKGNFPHLFNRKGNDSYVGPIAPSPYYNPNSMSPEDKETFMAWHQQMQDHNYVFNFKEEIVAYCCQTLIFTAINLFTIFTIASACHLVYHTNYLPKDTIAIIPPLGYSPKNRQSLFAHLHRR